MTNVTDHNALLLQVMAHDLLAPLTATKWQIELLTRSFKDKEKREKYLSGITDSTELGIALTKHAHVAAKVLSNSYVGDITKTNLPAEIRQATTELKMQYERHGLILEAEIEDENRERDLDVSLTKLFIWSVAKFFLSCVPPQTKVTMRGFHAQKETVDGKYIFIAIAEKVPDAKTYVDIISSQVARGALDQSYVFSKLINDIAPYLNVTYSADVQSEGISLEVIF